MICFKCDNETEFEVQEIDVLQEYLSSILKVHIPVTICKCCGFQSLDIGQVDELMKRTKICHEEQCDKDHWFRLDTLDYSEETDKSRLNGEI